MDELRSYDLRDPQSLIDDVASRATLTAGTAHLVLVKHPSTEQRVVSVQKLRRRSRPGNWEAACEELRTKIEAWNLPRESPPTHLATVVIARRGLCVVGYEEVGWLNAWRYVNHVQSLYSNELIVVTEHGWLDWGTSHAGHLPALSH